MIVDFELSDYAVSSLERASKGRILLAGTPGVYTQGFTIATETCLEYLRKTDKGVVIGGDSCRETLFDRVILYGGCALDQIINGDLAICEDLRIN